MNQCHLVIRHHHHVSDKGTSHLDLGIPSLLSPSTPRVPSDDHTPLDPSVQGEGRILGGGDGIHSGEVDMGWMAVVAQGGICNVVPLGGRGEGEVCRVVTGGNHWEERLDR
jgi:hypothetical protein